MPASVTRNRRIERAGVNALRALLEEHDQIVQEIDGGNDFGEDLFVMLTRGGERTGASITVQVKSGDKYKRANGYAIPVDAHASDWRNALLPVFGVVFDVGSRQLFWVNLTETLESSKDAPTWIPVPCEQELHAGNLDSFLEVAHAFVEKRSSRHTGETALHVARVSGTSRSAPSWFVGRGQERLAIKAKLAENGARRVLVSGMAGVGKTSLVDWVAGEPDTHAVFPGGVIVADMHGFSVNRDQLARAGTAYAPLLSALGVPAGEIPRDIESQAALYHRMLDTLGAAGSPVLLVFDNVAELSQIAELLPRGTAHGVIITSRSRLGIIEGVETIKLECLDPAESEVLFGKNLSPGDDRLRDPLPIQEITKLCGHLPLALSVSAAIMKEYPDLTPAELLAELAAAKTRLDVLQFGDTAVRAALHVSLIRLDECLRAPFCKLSIHPGSQMSEPIVAAVLGEDAPQARSVLRKLGQASLVSRVPGTSRWRMHDLVHLFSAEQCRATISEAEHRLAFARVAELYGQISHEADLTLRGMPRRGKPPRFDAVGDALSWFDADCANLQATARQAREFGMTEQAFELSMNLLVFLDLRGRVTEALQSAQAAHEAARQERNAERQVRALNNVGNVLTSLRRFEDAILALTKALAIAERIGFLDGQCDATTALGTAVRQHRSPAEAIPILVEAVRLARKNKDVNDIGTSLTNLGSAYREAGLPGPAARAYAESIRYHHASGDRRKEASGHAGLGTALFQLGQLERSVNSFQAAFTAYREVQDEFGIHLNHLNFGHTQLAMGNLSEARRSFQLAHHYFRDISNEFQEAAALALLGALEWMSNNLSQAQAHYNAALRVFRKLGSRQHVAAVEGSLREMLGVHTIPE
ncbi:tetratricopeptide repeat protein [Kitasatospora cineracea]|uniref:tetratricopeptide repeat protein n=1 Tax=Kitasatospora cineracea TaxID=88074 RepID=UPI00343C5C9A